MKNDVKSNKIYYTAHIFILHLYKEVHSSLIMFLLPQMVKLVLPVVAHVHCPFWSHCHHSTIGKYIPDYCKGLTILTLFSLPYHINHPWFNSIFRNFQWKTQPIRQLKFLAWQTRLSDLHTLALKCDCPQVQQNLHPQCFPLYFAILVTLLPLPECYPYYPTTISILRNYS